MGGLTFDYPDESAGKQAKAEGMARVAKPNAAWIVRCHKAIPFLPKTYAETANLIDYTGEDIKLAIRKKVGEPTHPNAWGPMIAGAKGKAKLIIPTGEQRLCKTKARHANKSDTYWIA